METIELRARRAYELGRALRSLRPALFIACIAAVALACDRPFALTCALAFALLAICAFLLFRGGSSARAVSPGLVAGFAALGMPMLLRTFGHLCLGASCMIWCLPFCALGGVLAGAWIARSGRGPAYVLPAILVAALAGSMGCSMAGSFGVLAMLAGVVLGGAPIAFARGQ